MSSENRDLCMKYLRKCKASGKLLGGFQEVLTILQSELTPNGLSDKELKLLVSVITKNNLNSVQRASLIKCLIPIGAMSKSIVEDIGLWFVSTAQNVQVLAATAACHWLIGLIDFGLTEMKTVNTFYDSFFYILVKHQKLASCVSRLIYMLTKPEDVTRRQVSRILTLQSQHTKPQKYLTALLSLFKSYKPEHVPEKIPSTNIENAWKQIPESLRHDLHEAARRHSGEVPTASRHHNIVWNPVTGVAKSTKKHQSLIPMVRYINIGSSISREPNSKSIFEVTSLEELGKHQLSLELPCNALSLLANTAGLHILTFASADYQSRFCYNLYNMLQNAFIHEVGKFSYEERDRLLSTTVKLCHYMQQEIILVSRFLQNYLPFWNKRDHCESFLALVEWISFPSFADIYDNILVPLQVMWECSSVDIKCQILSTFGNMITKLFVKQGIAESRSKERALFLGNTQTLELAEILKPLIEFVNNLIVSALYTEENNSILLYDALSFYEQIARLEQLGDLLSWTIAPPAVIYGGFLNRSVNSLTRVCSLLLKYRDINAKLKERRSRDLFEGKIITLDTYAKDLAKGLLYNEAFRGSEDEYLLRYIPESQLLDLKRSCALDTALNVSHHCAVLPYKFSLLDMGLEIQTMEDCIDIAEIYYPDVAKFLRIFRE